MTSHPKNLQKWLSATTLVCQRLTLRVTALAVKWDRWKRAFDLYLVARGETSEAQKRALFCIVLICLCKTFSRLLQTRELTMMMQSVPWMARSDRS